MDTRKQLFDTASAIEEISIALEDAQNLLVIYDDQIWEWWKFTKALMPQLSTAPDTNFQTLRSLLSAARWSLDRAAAQTQQAQENAYNLAAEAAVKA